MSKVFLIMAGGTGGHVFPALACAQKLRQDGHIVYWLGTSNGLENKVCTQQQIKLYSIKISGVRGKGWQALLSAPFKIIFSIWQSLKIMFKLKPCCALGFGGYVTGPAGIAAWLMRIPLVIHEQNAILGTTNRLLSIFAVRKCEGFAHTFIKRTNIVTSGNPVRRELFNLPIKPSLKNRRAHILVLGGSLGAEPINKIVPKALSLLDINLQPQVLHQAGNNNVENTLKLYDKANFKADVVAFIDEMSKAYFWADLIICRAGALTVAELCATGTGAILIPLPHAIDDHQTHNAQVLVAANAALMFKQQELTAEYLANILQQLMQNYNQIEQLAANAKNLAKPDACEQVITTCYEVAK